MENAVKKENIFYFKGSPIVVGKKMSPLKGIIYGDNGIGKTSILSCAKNPLIIDMEGNCSHIKAPSVKISNISDFHELINSLIDKDHEYKSLVVDSLDSLQILIADKMSKDYDAKELSYGKSNGIFSRKIKEIVDKFEMLQEKKKMNILFTAHWKVKMANNPMVEAYDRYDLRINEEMRTGFCNWVQFILLANKEVLFEDKKDMGFGKKKAKGIERRVLHTAGDPTYYGKNVFNFPKKMGMETEQAGWDNIINNVKIFYNS